MNDSSADIEKLVADFEERAAKAGELSVEIRGAPTPAAAADDTLIRSVAENLAAIRETAGLPSKGPGHFEEQIRLRQKR